MDLTPDQLVHLERAYRKKRADYRDEWMKLTRGELWDKRTKQFRERSEMIYGTLDEPPQLVMRKTVEQSVFDPAKTLANRRLRQQDALQTLHKIVGQPVTIAEARALIHGLLERAQNPPEPEARAYQNALIDESCRNLSALPNATSEDVRELAAGQ
jgi:hypothetical protein